MAEDENIKIKDYLVHTPPLGQGAYGKVFRATYRGISDRALKIFRPGAVDLSTMARELEKLSQVAEHQASTGQVEALVGAHVHLLLWHQVAGYQGLVHVERQVVEPVS